MRTFIDKCDKNTSIYDFAANNTSTGNISFEVYGNKADNWINGKGRLPYIVIDGKMQWNVLMKKATIFDLAKTFQFNVGNSLEIIYDEVQNWGSFIGNIKLQNRIFKKFLKNAVRRWQPKEKMLNVHEFIKYIDQTGVELKFVLDAIWIIDFYSIEEFQSLFVVSKRQAVNILRCAGYEKKKCNPYYYLEYQRHQSLLDCIEKTEGVTNEKECELDIVSRIRKKQFRTIEKLGENLAEYGRYKNYRNINNLDLNEPAYNKRYDKLDVILASLLVVGMLTFITIIVATFSYQITVYPHEKSDTIYSFWGSVAGSMIAGLITIFTTYLIIQRSYKIDFHQERIAALPFFEVNVVGNHFSTEVEEDIPPKINDIIKNQICYSTSLLDDAMLIEIVNTGTGPAFRVTVEGLTVDYEEPVFQSITVDNRRYMICYSRNDINFIIKYYDIYNNYYYQRFQAETNSDSFPNYVAMNTNPPEMILRTKRTRYIQ